ncbi:MAG: NADH-quinone oxidoreductase subunit B [Candidatus Nanopelagicales bacterium]
MSSVNVLQAGLACCGVESSSVDLVAGVWERTESVSKLSAAQHILVIAGTVTHALAPTVKSAYDALQEPKVVVAFGACAISGGPYWDSYSVISGAHEVVPVDIQVPGCPPGPEGLAAALLQAVELTRK